MIKTIGKFTVSEYIYGPKIGIIGLGFVGDAIQASFGGSGFRLVRNDPAKGYTDTYDALKECEGIFVCVPSPQRQDGSCDSSILEDVLTNLKGYKGVIISKVTATPDIYERLQNEYDNLVYSPEFLTAANAAPDYLKENWAVIGGSVLAYKKEAERIIALSKPLNSVQFCSIGEAALVKYTINSFLATKVIFMNELSDIAQQNRYNWNTIRNCLALDERIGKSHTQVPGPDGLFGFGGMCFPKDTSALLYYANCLDIDLNVLNSAVKKNTILRLKKSEE